MTDDKTAAESLAAHPYVLRAESVTFGDGPTLVEVSFRGALPEPFATLDRIEIVGCWMDTDPGWWGTLLGDRRAQRLGLGTDCLTALVEVADDA